MPRAHTTLAEPGGNTFLATEHALELYTPLVGASASFVYAVGNTWTGDEQGSDGAGHYAPLTGKVLDVISIAPTDPGVPNGLNYVIGGGPTYGATLRLAEVP